ncbi:PREDICTED: F-box/kelch-repeat protein At4g39753-like [Camelina sativa]|uniref:F-box/kelch-repeat protein At4g39753-like n=1 Tax=Camelina sativa TaxID=90675 RepID=A0ABM0Y4B9_CAMSA|nr:PREDICTED: F-box/kelch-repeat protein At4g39753-like [Camelina sativa]
MKGRSAIRGLELKKRRKNETELCGLWCVPDDVVVDCLTLLSRLDLVALSMVSKRYRDVAKSHYPSEGLPSPIYVRLYAHVSRSKSTVVRPPPRATSAETAQYGLLVSGPVHRVTPMKMARSGASASLIDNRKIYVFGGCWDAADSSNWAEVYDPETRTWEFLPVSTPKMPLKIQQSVVTDDSKHVYAVDEDGQMFKFSTSECVFEAETDADADADYGNDWLLVGAALFCRGTGGRILWRIPFLSAWKEVKGLEELQQQHSGFDIIKFCFSRGRSRMAIFWEARPQGPDDQILELWYAEFSIAPLVEGQVLEVVANIEWSGAVLSSDSSSTGPLNLLYAVSLLV